MALREIVLSAVVGAAVSLTTVQTKAAEIKPDGWPVPDVSGSRFLKERKTDIISEIPGRETVQKAYKTTEGTYFNTLEYNGHKYGFYVDVDGRSPMEYTLLDRDGDGCFEHKSSNESWGTPSYLLASNTERE